MSTVYVLDTGVLVSTWTDKKEDATFITTPNILDEVRNRLSRFRAETLVYLEKMKERTPVKDDIRHVEAASASAGDKSVLSQNDIELIALALTVARSEFNTILVSTDFAVLNTASHLGIRILDPNKRFGQEITWGMRCPACHYKTEAPTRDTECPVCGTTMRRTPLKKRKMT